MKIVQIMFTAFDKDEVAQKKITIGSVKKNKLWLTCFFLLFMLQPIATAFSPPQSQAAPAKVSNLPKVGDPVSQLGPKQTIFISCYIISTCCL